MKINHGLHGLNGFSNVDLAAKAADFPDGVYVKSVQSVV